MTRHALARPFRTGRAIGALRAGPHISCRNSLAATASDLGSGVGSGHGCHNDATGLAAGGAGGPCDHEQVSRSRLLILVTGCVPGAGKSSLAASLATALQAGGTGVE